jgi:hypothetical protein
MKRTVIPVEFRPHVKGSKIVSQENSAKQLFLDPLKRRSFIYDLARGQKKINDEVYEYYRKCVLDLFPSLKPKEEKC